MQLPKKNDQKFEIKDYYSLKLKSVWRGFWREHFSLWFLCLYFLFEYIRPQSLYPGIGILPWSFLFMLFAVIAAYFDKTVKWTSNPLNKYIVLCMIVVFLSSVFSYYPEISWKYRNTMLTWLVVYFLMISIVNTEKRLIIFLLAFMLYNLKMSQHGVHDWASRGFSFASYGLIGSPGWFRNSGEFAIEMLIFGSLAIAYVISFYKYWGKIKRWVLIILASTGYLCVLGASSRGSQLALVGIFIWGVLRIRGGFKFLFIAVVFAIALYQLLPKEELDRFRTAGDDVTSIQRLVYWKIGMEIAREHPILGIGYENWMPFVSNLYPEGVGPLKKVQVCHNIYIQAASELGYTGLIIFLITAFAGFVVNNRTRKVISNSDSRHYIILSYGLDAGLFGYLIAGTFVTVLYYPFFWIQLAIIATLNNLATIKSKEKSNFIPDEIENT